MTPLIVLFALVSTVSLVFSWLNLRALKSPGVLPAPPLVTLPVTSSSSDHELVRLAIEEMSKVSQMALNPYPAGAPTGNDELLSPRQMPVLEEIVDDDRDPMEVFLDPLFLRETSAILGGGDDPFGIPGLRPMEGE